MAPEDKGADALFDEFLDPAIQKILDEADLMEAVRTSPVYIPCASMPEDDA